MPNLIEIHLTISEWSHSNRLTQSKGSHFAANTIWHVWGALWGGWGGFSPAQATPTPTPSNILQLLFDEMTSNVLRALPFSRAEPLQSVSRSADDDRKCTLEGCKMTHKLDSFAWSWEERSRLDLVVWIGRASDGGCSCVLCVVLCWSAVAYSVTLLFVTLLYFTLRYSEDSFLTIFN